MAYGTVPNAQFAQTLMLTDQLARLNPFYDHLAQSIRVPFTRDLMNNGSDNFQVATGLIIP
jgi:hypothetical protein